jgi:hypothetical protein
MKFPEKMRLGCIFETLTASLEHGKTADQPAKSMSHAASIRRSDWLQSVYVEPLAESQLESLANGVADGTWRKEANTDESKAPGSLAQFEGRFPPRTRKLPCSATKSATRILKSLRN